MVRALRCVLVGVVLGILCTSTGLAGCGKREAVTPSATEIQEFQAAMDDGDAAIVDRLLSAKPGLVNVRDAQGRTPLQQARARDDSELISVIERHGGKE